MAIVGEVQMESLRRVTDMVKKFEAMKVSHFKGENVRDYCTAASSLLLQLEREDQVPSTHLLTIIDALTEVSVQAFAVMWMAKKRDVDNFIRDSAGKDPSVVRSLPNYIHFQNLLDTAKSDYQNLLHKWGPASAPKQDPVKAMQAKLDSVTQQLSKVNQKLTADPKKSSGGGGAQNNKRKCFRCGSTDHMVKDCPKPAPERTSNGSGSNGNGGGPNNGKWAPPGPNDPHTKKVNGTIYYYCKHCCGGKGLWTQNHTTDKHGPNYKKKSMDKGTPTASLSILSPGLWSS